MFNLRRAASLKRCVVYAVTGTFGAVAFVGTALAQSQRKVTPDELAKHNSPDDLWVAVNGKIYNLTDFAPNHPGGEAVLRKYAGKDGSFIYNKHHAPDLADSMLEDDQKIGVLDGEVAGANDEAEAEARHRAAVEAAKPPLNEIINPNDFEYVAKRMLNASAWAYYSSGAEDEITYRENHNAFRRIFFKPRVCIDVDDVDLSTTMLGLKTAAPFYCSAAAQAKLGYEDGELSIARGCGKSGIIQMISSYASFPLEEISNQIPGQQQWFQLYTLPTKEATQSLINKAVNNGSKAIFVTVDTPAFGLRERDLRLKAEDDSASSGTQSIMKSMRYDSAHRVTWDLVDAWKNDTDVPIVLKGVGSVEDIILAAQHGIKAVVLSNHGGRQLDFARAPVEVLADAMPALREKGLDDKIEIYIDGGVRRGSDILKALALGAKGVGLGRLFLYANTAYGEEGVTRLCEILENEMMVGMRLLGVNSIDQLRPEHLDLRGLHNRGAIMDTGYYRDFDVPQPPRFKSLDEISSRA